jgi:hypothetical protein
MDTPRRADQITPGNGLIALVSPCCVLSIAGLPPIFDRPRDLRRLAGFAFGAGGGVK